MQRTAPRAALIPLMLVVMSLAATGLLLVASVITWANENATVTARNSELFATTYAAEAATEAPAPLDPPAPDDDSPVPCGAPHPQRPAIAATSTDAQTNGRVFMMTSRLRRSLLYMGPAAPEQSPRCFTRRSAPTATL